MGVGGWAYRSDSLILWGLLLGDFLTLFAFFLWGSGLLDSLSVVSEWDDVLVNWEIKLLDEVSYTLVGKEVVRPSPVVDLVEASERFQGFDNHHSVEVGNRDVLMLWHVCVRSEEHTSELQSP